MNYQLPKPDPMTGEVSNIIIKLPERMAIPMLDDNPKYQKYLEWLAEGNTPLPSDFVDE